MVYSRQQLWERFQKYYADFPAIGLAVDISRMNFGDEFFKSMEGPIQKAFAEMDQLEKGAIANRDENRMVGHYWLRNPSLAPTPQIKTEIESTLAAIKQFAAEVHSVKITGETGARFQNLLVIGIGGSALGPQFVAEALGQPSSDKMLLYCLDNTDPAGIDKTLSTIGSDNLAKTLTVVISKSGGTKETRNGMIETEAAYKRAKLNFARHAVAVTSAGSQLDKTAIDQGWIKRFPMWDWVGGRTSELSAVGLLPAALQGLDIEALLAGARACDELTRTHDYRKNPAALLALMCFYIGNGRGTKNMVVLPYKDRLQLFSKYLQQLIMESLGKERDRSEKVVNQGVTVFGNKGSTDQHSYVQQLREGLSNFFVNFIEVLEDRKGPALEVEPGITAGDFLEGFLLGTRSALYENGRESLTITITKVNPESVGALIALYERVVGLYASLINVNAYHQPGVEAGKKAAQAVIDLQLRVVGFLQAAAGKYFSANELAAELGQAELAETIFKVCNHLAANGRLKRETTAGVLATKFGI